MFIPNQINPVPWWSLSENGFTPSGLPQGGPLPVLTDLAVHIATAYNGLPTASVVNLVPISTGFSISSMLPLNGTSISARSVLPPQSNPVYVNPGQNGLPVASFELSPPGAMNFSPTINNGPQFTVFFVASPSSVASSYLLTGSGVSANPAIISAYGGVAYEWWEAGPRYTFDASASGVNVLAVARDGSAGTDTVDVYFNNTQVVSTVVGAPLLSSSFIQLGFVAGTFAVFDFCEMIVYNKVKTPSEISSINDYLINKWGV